METTGHSRKPAELHHESGIARIIRYRRNALVVNALSPFGILTGFFLVLFPLGIGGDADNGVLLGLLVFLIGYFGLITGCWWWARAKCWNEGIVFIGLLPLVIPLIPWVRLIYVAIPMLLPIGMIMMPATLLVVMVVLPDKSIVRKRRRLDLGKIGGENGRR